MQRRQFETILRSRIVESAEALHQSGAAFATFATVRRNPQFWDLTANGGLRLKAGVTPAQGIRDIFIHGHQYAFECATAMVIVLYNAVLDSILESEFNRLFADMLLYDWHYDSDLKLIQSEGSDKASPGDIVYFNNPDVSSEALEWKGENAVKMKDNLFYGHGIGILPAQGIIDSLNQHRKPEATRSAYLTNEVIYPDFDYLSQFAPEENREDLQHSSNHQEQNLHIHAFIGGRQYIRR
ncbi:protein-glutamine gamma-glutamyltransferase [Paenibacillus farraposensis]|uniref:Protein-glutamine gamma-glutamyltransferase n=1 Tax=Paenibacillus farraposensis TaxID=2807095 RepID=A0ABW4DCT7_9BACL|nr:protein-glutamine gamma-glutamyltransferase [Paenibacillus farraposensis]MCC3379246.1 protein-glutamine gamma-glutamyltransferase [Paenibacillus farraposensis]